MSRSRMHSHTNRTSWNSTRLAVEKLEARWVLSGVALIDGEVPAEDTSTYNPSALPPTPVNIAPLSLEDNYTVDENGSLVVEPEFGVLANDVDPDSPVLAAVLVTPPSHGPLTLHDDGSFTYTPDPLFNREDHFHYCANDGTSDSNLTTVMIIVETDYPWYNGEKPENVSGDEYVSPQDYLLLLGTINDEGGRMLSTDRPRPLAPPFYDVSRDGMLSPRDLLLEIHYLNTVESGSADAESLAEAESLVAPEAVPMLPVLASAETDVLVIAQENSDVPWQAAADTTPLLAPLTGFPESSSLHEDRLWSDVNNDWTDQDLETMLTALVGEVDGV